ncbi:uncharacterized protein LOC116113179 [Pistacia vera]|uniref:uncharacterized protein LOC116113179 n=1 Tax=Pistacia vera TaxID=55513 RepID=UPI001263E3BB|nr:uncharacterized protein LOC116113179 [Pistacia vera]
MKKQGSRKCKRGRQRQPENQLSNTITKHSKMTLKHQPSASPSSKPPKSSAFLDKMQSPVPGSVLGSYSEGTGIGESRFQLLRTGTYPVNDGSDYYLKSELLTK